MAPATCGETLKRRAAYLDLGALPEQQHHRDFAITLTIEPFGHALDRRLAAQKHAQRFCSLAAALSSGSTIWMRARTSSPCSSADSISSTALPGSSRSRYCCSPSRTAPPRSARRIGQPDMPILLPVRVRRSVRDTTVAATRPALTPDLTARVNSTHDCTRMRLSAGM